MTSRLYPDIYLPCGSTAFFDHDSGISYRCETCGAVVGSIGQPRECYEEAKKYDVLEQLGGAGWDYAIGQLKKKTDCNGAY